VNQKKPRPQVKVGGKVAYLGTGRRKTSSARVMLTEGTGKISINGRTVEQFFTEVKGHNAVYFPLESVEMRNRVDLTIYVKGGGISGQAGAITQGIARALKEMFGLETEAPTPAEPKLDENGQPIPVEETTMTSLSRRLSDTGFLTRDSRMKERKKYGRKGARKSFQFSKR